jgi:HlyD family secretion protein
MKLEVQIDEADVGDVQNGQMATFTVDAYPNRTYQAKVDRLCLGAITTSGIVSYKAVLSVNNDDLSLRPGMTANAEIITLKREKAILAPIAGFRWSPPVQVSTSQTSGTNGGLVDKLMPRPPRPDENKEKEAASVNSRESQQTIWILKNGQPEAVSVTVGASNGSQAEIVSGNVEPGMKVITGTATRNK